MKPIGSTPANWNRKTFFNPQGYVLISMTTDGKNAGDEPYWLKSY